MFVYRYMKKIDLNFKSGRQVKVLFMELARNVALSILDPIERLKEM